MEKEPVYLNAKQAAAYLGVERQRIYALIKEGRIGIKIADYWVFTKEELDQYIQERTARPKGGRPRKLRLDADASE